MMLDSSLEVSLGLLKAMACKRPFFAHLIMMKISMFGDNRNLCIVTEAQRKDAVKLVKAQMAEVKKEAHKVTPFINRQ
jgi:hypothetical protein